VLGILLSKDSCFLIVSFSVTCYFLVFAVAGTPFVPTDKAVVIRQRRRLMRSHLLKRYLHLQVKNNYQISVRQNAEFKMVFKHELLTQLR
jgi:hypothetical protein